MNPIIFINENKILSFTTIIALIALGFSIASFIKTHEPFFNLPGNECKPNEHKCLTKTKNNQYHYFCSKHKNCNTEDVTGELIDEPMAWQVRFA